MISGQKIGAMRGECVDQPPGFQLLDGVQTVAAFEVGEAEALAHGEQLEHREAGFIDAGKALVDQRFLARSGDISIGPFLLGPGNYSLRLNATDAYGRTRSLTWVVALAP